ncbi:TerC family protein [Geminicoccus roseus]|uniref:TerC family protein n=1 Tax=Geminicoccus roseus TaxID=404900 RepID=UPI00040B3C83|nr:TerC family protein [Geminicoccus roseus]
MDVLALLTDPAAWASLAALTALEIVLGIDNLIFLSIVASRLPAHQQNTARRLGLSLALLMRLGLLAGIAWIVGLTEPIASIGDFEISWRDIIMLGGGLFLLAKGTLEIHHTMEEQHTEASTAGRGFAMAIVQIVLLDIVFSLDSVITAVGMADHLSVMVTAVVISMIVMLVAAEPVGNFVNRHPTVKMLALAFLVLVGTMLVAEGLHFHVPRGYVYFAIAFSAGVEALNLMARRKRLVVKAN